MANSFGNPIVITTAMTATLKNTSGNGLAANEGLRIQKIIWDGATAAGTINIQYGDGTVFLNGTAQATTNPNPINYDFFGGRVIYDFKVATVTSGAIYIYYDPS